MKVKPIYFIGFFFYHLLIMSVTAFICYKSYGFGLFSTPWLIILWIGMFLGMSLGFSVFLTFGYQCYHQYIFNSISRQLEKLLAGQYQEEEMSYQRYILRELLVPYEPIFHQITKIRSQLLQWSQELKKMGAQPILVEGETKEEILKEERHRIARELHDSVSQQLFAAMMMISAVNEQKESLSPQLKSTLSAIEKTIAESQAEMRALLLHLRPIDLENKTLKEGIESLLKELKTKLHLSLSWQLEEVVCGQGVEDHLFRIVQELISNVLSHAHASHISVYLRQTKEYVILRVEDDGQGFDPSIEVTGGYGLLNMKERVHHMGGHMKLVSLLGQGTSVEVFIPTSRTK